MCKHYLMFYSRSDDLHEENSSVATEHDREQRNHNIPTKRKINVFLDGTVIECGGYKKTVVEISIREERKYIPLVDNAESLKKEYRQLQAQMRKFLDE